MKNFNFSKFLVFAISFVLLVSGLQVAQADIANSVSEKYIIRFMDDDDAGAESNEIKKQGIKVDRVLNQAFKGLIGDFSVAQLNELKKNPKFLYAEKDGPVHTTTFSTIPVLDNSVKSWGLDRINQRNLPLDSSYSYQYNGQGVKAYVIDTGINASHSEFVGRVLPGNTQIVDANGTNDCNGHGTHVAGTIGGSTFGVARAVSLIPVRVLDCLGSGTTSGVIAGIDWVIANHASNEPAVANLSLGGGKSLALNDAIARLVADNVVVAVAAGNSNADACSSSPSSAPSAITVGASERADNRASYSNFGTCLDIFAPGSAIVSSWIGSANATNTISGTSMASPHVAGAAALLLEKNPSFTPAQIQDQMTAGATPNKVSSPGTGSINLLLATETAGPYTAPVLTVPATPSAPSISSTATGRLAVTVSTANNGGSAIRSYSLNLWTSPTSNGALTLARTVTVTSSALSVSATITGLTSRTFYVVTASASNAIGNSGVSANSNRVQVR